MSNVEAISAAIPNLDVRPILPVSDETVLDDAVVLRDRIAAAMMATLEQEDVLANLLKSEPGNFPAWVRLEAWTPLGADIPPRKERCELELIVQARPFNRHPLVCGARLKRGKQTIAVADRSHFTERDVAEWTRYAIGRGPRPSNYRPMFDTLRAYLATFVPPLGPRYNPIDRQFRGSPFDLRVLLAVAACVLLTVGLIFRELLTPVTLVLAGATIVCAALLPALGRYYRYSDWVAPQPRERPRRLGHIDSWHAVLVGLGDQTEHLKQRLIAGLGEMASGMLEIRSERYGYRTPNGYEERERLVVSHRQGHVHVHFYPIGDDLFVGWQAHLNWAQWVETPPVTTMDAGRGRIAFRNITPSWYQPNEFDLIDLNSLSAVVHNALEREVKILLSQSAIDQELDFEVVRGDRGNALDARKAWPERSNKRQRNSNIIFGSNAVQRTSAGEMQLAPIDDKGSNRRGGIIAAIPAVILLPILMVLAYSWFYQSDFARLYQFRQTFAPNFRFVLSPVFSLTFAAVLAIGLFLYARISLIQALLVIAVTEVSTFSVAYAYYFIMSQLIVAQDLAYWPVAILFTSGGTLLASICYLMAASIWVPALRDGSRWLAGIVLWTVWAAASAWAIRIRLFELPPYLVLFLGGLGQGVFRAACFGYWLREKNPGRIKLRERTRTRAPSIRAAETPLTRKEGRSILLPIGVVFAFLGLVEFLVRAGIIRRFVAPLPSYLLMNFPAVVAQRNLASLLLQTFQDVVITSILVTAAGVATGLLLQRQQQLRTAVKSWIATTARAPVLLVYPAIGVTFGLDSTVKITAFAAGLAPAILKALEGGLPASPQKESTSLARVVFVTWLFSLALAFANVVSLETVTGSAGVGRLIIASVARLDVNGLYAVVFLAIAISALLTMLVAKAGVTAVSTLATPAVEGSRQSTLWLKILILAVILISWEMIARSLAAARGIVPPFTTVAEALIELLTRPQFYSNLYATCSRIAIGMLIGGLIAFALGMLLRRSKFFHRAFEPILYYLEPTPKILFYALLVLLLGIGGGALIAIAAFSCLLPVALCIAAQGGAGSSAQIRWSLAAGLRLGLRAAILSTLLGEGFTSNNGIGYLTLAQFERFQMGEGYALLILTIALSISADALMAKFVRARDGGH